MFHSPYEDARNYDLKESNLINKILISMPRNRILFRNTVGLLYDRQGNPIRAGLCVGSSDLIGWTSITITPEMVGKSVAVFTAVEAKTKNVRTTPEQQNFIDRVKMAGGIGEIIREE